MNSLRKFSACFVGARGQLQIGQLGDPIDQFRDFAPEAGFNLGIGGLGVFDRVVQQRGDDGRIVQPLFGQDTGHRHGMGEIRLPGMTKLTLVHLCA